MTYPVGTKLKFQSEADKNVYTVERVSETTYHLSSGIRDRIHSFQKSFVEGFFTPISFPKKTTGFGKFIQKIEEKRT